MTLIEDSVASTQIFTQIVVDSTGSVTDARLFSLNGPGFSPRGLSIATETLVYSIVLGTINLSPNQIGLQVTDLQAKNASVIQVLPSYFNNVRIGVFTRGSSFIVSQIDTKYSNFEDNIATLSNFKQIIVLSSD